MGGASTVGSDQQMVAVRSRDLCDRTPQHLDVIAGMIAAGVPRVAA